MPRADTFTANLHFSEEATKLALESKSHDITVARIRDEVTADLDGPPSPEQIKLIDRTAVHALAIARENSQFWPASQPLDPRIEEVRQRALRALRAVELWTEEWLVKVGCKRRPRDTSVREDDRDYLARFGITATSPPFMNALKGSDEFFVPENNSKLTGDRRVMAQCLCVAWNERRLAEAMLTAGNGPFWLTFERALEFFYAPLAAEGMRSLDSAAEGGRARARPQDDDKVADLYHAAVARRPSLSQEMFVKSEAAKGARIPKTARGLRLLLARVEKRKAE